MMYIANDPATASVPPKALGTPPHAITGRDDALLCYGRDHLRRSGPPPSIAAAPIPSFQAALRERLDLRRRIAALLLSPLQRHVTSQPACDVFDDILDTIATPVECYDGRDLNACRAEQQKVLRGFMIELRPLASPSAAFNTDFHDALTLLGLRPGRAESGEHPARSD